MNPSEDNAFEALVERFKRFPGIGPRQASRFVYYLLGRGKQETELLRHHLAKLHSNVRQCEESQAYFYSSSDTTLSPIAQNPNRDRSVLMIVERDSDLEAIERSGVYNGQYFVLGGTVPLMEREPEKRVRGEKLVERVKKGIEEDELSEVIIATSATTEGDHTSHYVEKLLDEFDITITHLGRGLSTGTELEYVDRDTIQSALKNRA